jgi:hypothetical protein
MVEVARTPLIPWPGERPFAEPVMRKLAPS